MLIVFSDKSGSFAITCNHLNWLAQRADMSLARISRFRMHYELAHRVERNSFSHHKPKMYLHFNCRDDPQRTCVRALIKLEQVYERLECLCHAAFCKSFHGNGSIATVFKDEFEHFSI